MQGKVSLINILLTYICMFVLYRERLVYQYIVDIYMYVCSLQRKVSLSIYCGQIYVCLFLTMFLKQPVHICKSVHV